MLLHPFCLLAISYLSILPVCSQSISTTVVVATTVTSYYTAAAATAPLSPQYTDSLDFRTSILNSTNFYRYEHSASYIYWNTSLAQYAQSYSEKCVWEHSHGPYGENLARGYANVTEAVEAWGNERSMYDFNSTDPTGFTEATGHFTQLVWKSTQATGCGWTNCNGKNGLEGVFLVCEYYPPGNIVGDNNSYFKSNISPQKSGGESGFNEEAATQGATGGVPSSTTASSPSASATSSGGESVGNPNLEVGVSRVFATICVTVAAVFFGWGMS
ncbi:CAP domain-containing protein [Exophiala viscosa]|uniref:CAP domain-containing protein n=1 Tax=Exophiala viscosa TaxID=2486360 RepID=A0AAN6DXJ6_9EURO|nr:CAP domain-containing protein [Exophiala viscosa]